MKNFKKTIVTFSLILVFSVLALGSASAAAADCTQRSFGGWSSPKASIFKFFGCPTDGNSPSAYKYSLKDLRDYLTSCPDTSERKNDIVGKQDKQDKAENTPAASPSQTAKTPTAKPGTKKAPAAASPDKTKCDTGAAKTSDTLSRCDTLKKLIDSCKANNGTINNGQLGILIGLTGDGSSLTSCLNGLKIRLPICSDSPKTENPSQGDNGSNAPSAPSATPTPSATPAPSTPKPSPSDNGSGSSKPDNLSFEQQVVNLVNKERTAHGLSPLALNEKLSNVARLKSQDMHDKKYFDHNSPTYGSPFDMMRSFGISYRTAGENIAMGYKTPEAVMNGWMNSPGHRANILNSSFTQIGVGYVSDGNYWTQQFIG